MAPLPTDQSALPQLYLFSAYFKKTESSKEQSSKKQSVSDKSVRSKLQPVVDTVVYVAPKEQKQADDKDKAVTQILRTDKLGKLCPIKKKDLAEKQALNAAKPQRLAEVSDDPLVSYVVVPPIEAVSFLAAAKGDDWGKELIASISGYLDKAKPEALKLNDYKKVDFEAPKKQPILVQRNHVLKHVTSTSLQMLTRN